MKRNNQNKNEDKAWFLKLPTMLTMALAEVDSVHQWTMTEVGTFYTMLSTYYCWKNTMPCIRLSSLRKKVCCRGKTKLFDGLAFDRYLFMLEPTCDGTDDYWISTAIDFINITPAETNRIIDIIGMRSEKDAYVKPGESGYCNPYERQTAPEEQPDVMPSKEECLLPEQLHSDAAAAPERHRGDSSLPYYIIREKEKERKNIVVDNNSSINNISYLKKTDDIGTSVRCRGEPVRGAPQ